MRSPGSRALVRNMDVAPTVLKILSVTRNPTVDGEPTRKDSGEMRQ